MHQFEDARNSEALRKPASRGTWTPPCHRPMRRRHKCHKTHRRCCSGGCLLQQKVQRTARAMETSPCPLPCCLHLVTKAWVDLPWGQAVVQQPAHAACFVQEQMPAVSSSVNQAPFTSTEIQIGPYQGELHASTACLIKSFTSCSRGKRLAICFSAGEWLILLSAFIIRQQGAKPAPSRTARGAHLFPLSAAS